MSMTKRYASAARVALLMTAMTAANAAAAEREAAPNGTPAGRWDATVVVNGVDIPFRFDVEGNGAGVKGSFFDGEKRVTSTHGTLDGSTLDLTFDQYASRLVVTFKEDRLEGTYKRNAKVSYPFSATRYVKPARPAGDVPSIDGLWKIGLNSPKGESAWRFIVRQSGADVSASILRVDGDTGTLSGSFKDGKFVLSHFSGARPTLLEVTPAADGTLNILQNGKTKLVAVKEGSAQAADVGEPTDPSKHTRWKDPGERFQFAFNDLTGKPVTQDDPRFAGKVVVISITGSWCPNCRDEAPFLAQLYKKYRSKGLEVVALSFEEEEQLADPTRLRAFIKEYGIEYTVLLAGQPDELTAKVPQAENLNAFPTTFFLGKDGRVRATHAGFPSPASGKFYTQAQRDVTAEVERLLAERAPATAKGTK